MSLLVLVAIVVVGIIIGGLVALNLAGAASGVLCTLIYRHFTKKGNNAGST